MPMCFNRANQRFSYPLGFEGIICKGVEVFGYEISDDLEMKM